MELTVDGRTIQAEEGELLVHALARHGIFVPTLCHDAKLDPYGGCRICVVDVEGAPRPVPSCATRVAEGMAVSTNGATGALRQTLTEMLLTEHLTPTRAAGRTSSSAWPRSSAQRRRSSSPTRGASPTRTATG